MSARIEPPLTRGHKLRRPMGMDDGRENEFLGENEMERIIDEAVAEALRPERADSVLEQAAKTYRERHAVYGDNYRMVGKIMAVLFPGGVKLETEADHNRFHIFMLEVVKLTRYANNWARGGHEDSQLDLSVYAAMLVEIDREAARDEPKLP